jgi:spore coat protein U-like protein
MGSLKYSAVIVALVAAFIAPAALGQCTWTTQPTGVAFGTYSVFAPADDLSNVNFTISCTALRQASIALSRGGSGTYTPRRMSGTANYNLWGDAGRTIIWGDGSGGTYTFSAVNWSLGTLTYSGTICGSIPAGQDLAPGSYSDTITATLSYTWAWGGTWTQVPPVTFPVTMNIIAECRVDTFNLAFGNYNPFAPGALNQTSTVKVYCTKTTSPTLISLDNGANASGSQKRMAGPAGAFLNYNTTLAASGGTSTSSLVPIVGGITLNGTIPSAQDARIGNYVDTLQALINY